jgi:hypothetical protein
MRHSQRFLGARYFKRLDIEESSTGENAAFVDSWIRTGSADFDTLLLWTQKAGSSSVVVFDLWESALRGTDLSQHGDKLAESIATSGMFVVLSPRVHFAGWMEALALADFSEPTRAQLVARLDVLRASYEWLINLPYRFAIVEGAPTAADFAAALNLSFNRTTKFGGLVHLVPAEIASGLMGFHEIAQVQDAVLAAVGQLQSGGIRQVPHMHLPPGKPMSFRKISPHSVIEVFEPRSAVGPLVRRCDGVLALKSRWGPYLSTVRSGAVTSAPRQHLQQGFGPLERQMLTFLSRYEAHWAHQSEPESFAASLAAGVGGPSAPASQSRP